MDHLPKEYYAVIFTSTQTGEDEEEYAKMATRMVELASQQEGYLGIESVHDTEGQGITVSYWKDEASIRQWRQNAEHLEAQGKGREKWYRNFSLRVAKVEREYHFSSEVE